MKLSPKLKSLFWMAVVLAIPVLTWIGLSQHYPETNTLRYLPDRLFRLVKTVMGNDPLGSGVEPAALPWSLIAAKLLLTLVLLRTLLKVVEKVFHEQYAQLRALFKQGHTIIVGAGDKGRLLAQDLAAAGQQAVIIEQQAGHPQADILRRQGHILLNGNAADADTLQHAGALRARQLICFADNEQTGFQVAHSLQRLYARHRPDNDLLCCLHLHNPLLADTFQQHGQRQHGLNVRYFNAQQMLARRFFHHLPQHLAAALQHPQAHIHFLLFGFGDTAQSLLLQGLRVFHLLPCQSSAWQIFCREADAEAARFRDRYPQAERIAPLHFHPHTGCYAALCAAHTADLPEHSCVVAICADEDSRRNLDTAAELLRSQNTSFPIYVCHRSGHALPTLLDAAAQERLRFFGSDSEGGSVELATGAKQDRLAQAMHADYLGKTGSSGSESTAFLSAWEGLPENAKDANRAQADHLIYKLLLSGQLDTVRQGRAPQFTPEQTEQLAATEHARWAAHRYLNGWQYGAARDDERRLHPSLIDWDSLSETEKQKDRDTILRIPAILGSSQDLPL